MNLTKDTINTMQLGDILTLALSTQDLMDMINTQKDNIADLQSRLASLQDDYQKVVNHNYELMGKLNK
jgi:hypothetical protein